MRRDTPQRPRNFTTTHNYLVLSDLHLSEGIDPRSGKLSATEDFFHDESFARLLVYHLRLSRDLAADPALRKPWKLYINGDFLEYLQVVSLPPEDHPLVTTCGVKLEGNIREFGLGTSQPESVWKTGKIVEGHPVFFQALGWFLAYPDNELILVRGNHDVELYWPKVQEAILYLIEKQYRIWYQKTTRGLNIDSPLPLDDHPQALPADFRRRVSFPAWFVHEPPLFYMEHGHQYDPNNAFPNFLDPILPKNPKLIELPAGSFFVRYFFNQIEQMHPFADNLRPLTRYINWAINEAFSDTVRMIMRRPSDFWQAISNLLRKQGKFSQNSNLARFGSRYKLPIRGAQLHMLEDLRQQALKATSQRNGQALRRITGRFLLHIAAWILGLLGLREFVLADYLPALAWFIACGGSLLAAARRGGQLSEVDNPLDLPEISRRIVRILNREYRGTSTAVQFHIFGHDHCAAIEEITPEGQELPYRQWYVNTGSWLPIFEGMNRLSRGDIQLAFLRLIPDRPGFDREPPELLEWHYQENRPRPIRVLNRNAQQG